MFFIMVKPWSIQHKVIDSKDASVKSVCLKMLRTVLLATLGSIVTKTVAKCIHKKANMSMLLKYACS